jgi:hypothetical protein
MLLNSGSILVVPKSILSLSLPFIFLAILKFFAKVRLSEQNTKQKGKIFPFACIFERERSALPLLQSESD